MAPDGARPGPARVRALRAQALLAAFTTVALAWAVSAAADAPRLVTVVDAGLEFPTAIAALPDGSDRLLVAERGGRLRVLHADGRLQAEPWYQRATHTDDMEQGLLAVAADPGFADNGTVYIAYSGTPAESWGLIIRRLVADDPGADRFDGRDEVVLQVPGLVANHNAGDLRFGPDGLLYVAVGAGTGEPADHAHAAALDDLRGKVLRLDVRADAPRGDGRRCGGRGRYGIPADNPHVDDRDACAEVFLHGLRNPWRIAVDDDGALWLADVGKDREELSRWRPGDVRDLGFPRCQGRHDYPDRGRDDCPSRTATLAPLYDFAGGDAGRCAIIGGLVYRGANRALAGAYVFADACSSDFYLGRLGADGAFTASAWSAGVAAGYGTIASFGAAADGRLYVVNHLAGSVYRID